MQQLRLTRETLPPSKFKNLERKDKPLMDKGAKLADEKSKLIDKTE